MIFIYKMLFFFRSQILLSFVDEVLPLDDESSAVLRDALLCLASKVRYCFYRLLNEWLLLTFKTAPSKREWEIYYQKCRSCHVQANTSIYVYIIYDISFSKDFVAIHIEALPSLSGSCSYSTYQFWLFFIIHIENLLERIWLPALVDASHPLGRVIFYKPSSHL